MSIISGAIHAIGDVVAPVANITGDVTGAGSLKQLAANISSPTATLTSDNPLTIAKAAVTNNDPAFRGSGADYPSTTGATAPVTISNGTPSTSNTSSTSGTTSGDTSGTSSTLAADIAPGVTEGTDALAAALAALNGGNTTDQDQYTAAVNGLDSEQTAAQNTEQQALNSDTEGLTTAEQEAREQGNSDYNSLMRALSALGGASSTVASELIPELVQQSVQNNISNADQTNAQAQNNAITTYEQWFDNTLNPGLATDKSSLLSDQANNQTTYNQEANELTTALAALKGATDSDQVADDEETLDDDYHDITPVTAPIDPFSGNVATYVQPNIATYELTPTQIAAAAGTIAPAAGTVLPINLVTNNQQQNNQQQNNTPAIPVAS